MSNKSTDVIDEIRRRLKSEIIMVLPRNKFTEQTHTWFRRDRILRMLSEVEKEHEK